MNNLDWLAQPNPHQILAAAHKDGTLAQFLPEVEALYGVPQSKEHHPEICTGRHIELCLEIAETLNLSFSARIAVLLHDLGKALTPLDMLPRHLMHERNGLASVNSLCDRLQLDSKQRKLSLLVCGKHLEIHRIFEARPSTVANLLNDSGMEFDEFLLNEVLSACESDARGRLGFSARSYPQARYLRDARQILQTLPASTAPLGERQHLRRLRERIDSIRSLRSGYAEAAQLLAQSC